MLSFSSFVRFNFLFLIEIKLQLCSSHCDALDTLTAKSAGTSLRRPMPLRSVKFSRRGDLCLFALALLIFMLIVKPVLGSLNIFGYQNKYS